MNRYLAGPTLSVLLLASIPLSALAQSPAEYVRTDRYTLARVEVLPEQQEPLRAVATFTFGSHVRTVGDALREMLKGSGYRWEPTMITVEEQSDALLNTLPLPAVLRNLGPVRLDDALHAVAGEAWVLNVDPLHRKVWFTVRNRHSSNNTEKPAKEDK